MTKRCRHCNEVKDASEFPLNKKVSDGLSSWCRRCTTEASKRSRRKRRQRERKPRPTLAERWQKRVLVTAGCWLWQGQKLPLGYGKLHVGKQVKLAHRIAYELAHGPIADGMHVHHVCGNPSCVRPTHLELVERIEHERMHARMAAGDYLVA